MTAPFLGSEALASGTLNRHQLRSRFRALYPNVYLPADITPTLAQRTTGAWLWSQRKGVVAGLAAAALHGAKWIDTTTPIEMVHGNPRAAKGVLTRRDTLLPEETMLARGAIAVTTPARTAFDIGRRIDNIGIAVARLDALSRATGVTAADVEGIASRHPGVRGLRQLETALALIDPGAQSPKESWLRLLLIRGGVPKPTTQIPVYEYGRLAAYLDMGWEEYLVAVEYDGDQHRTDRWQYVKDIRRLDMLKALGWIVIRVVAEDGAADILRRVRDALAARQSTVHPGRQVS